MATPVMQVAPANRHCHLLRRALLLGCLLVGLHSVSVAEGRSVLYYDEDYGPMVHRPSYIPYDDHYSPDDDFDGSHGTRGNPRSDMEPVHGDLVERPFPASHPKDEYMGPRSDMEDESKMHHHGESKFGLDFEESLHGGFRSDLEHGDMPHGEPKSDMDMVEPRPHHSSRSDEITDEPRHRSGESKFGFGFDESVHGDMRSDLEEEPKHHEGSKSADSTEAPASHSGESKSDMDEEPKMHHGSRSDEMTEAPKHHSAGESKSDEPAKEEHHEGASKSDMEEEEPKKHEGHSKGSRHGDQGESKTAGDPAESGDSKEPPKHESKSGLKDQNEGDFGSKSDLEEEQKGKSKGDSKSDDKEPASKHESMGESKGDDKKGSEGGESKSDMDYNDMD